MLPPVPPFGEAGVDVDALVDVVVEVVLPALALDDVVLLVGGAFPDPSGPDEDAADLELDGGEREQVGAWRKKEIEWVDARLRFKGRIERDDWVSQAKILAKGGETEFSRKKKTKNT